MVLDSADNADIFFGPSGTHNIASSNDKMLELLPRKAAGRVLVTTHDHNLGRSLSGPLSTFAATEPTPTEVVEMMHGRLSGATVCGSDEVEQLTKEKLCYQDSICFL